MPSFDRKSERPPAARFLDVTEGKLRAPAWVASQRAGWKRASDPSFRAPRLPSDLRALEAASMVPAAKASAAISVPAPKSIVPPPLTTLSSLGTVEPSLSIPIEAAKRRPSVLPADAEPDATLVQGFVDAIDGLSRARTIVLEDSVHDITELATTIARRVIARELSLDPTIVQGLVEEGLAALGQDDRIRVRLGARFARVATAIEQRLSVGSRRAEVMLDPALDPHGCIVETDLGRVDESIESRLSALLSALETDSQPPGV